MISFSAIIPAYNAAEFLIRAVNSCAKQTLAPKEIIVVLDGPDIMGRAILENMQEPLLRIIEFPENKGPSAARNLGWDAATADFVAFLDADDEWEPTKLESMAAAIDKIQAKVIFHDFKYSSDSSIQKERGNTEQISTKSILFSNPTATCGLIVQRIISMRYDELMRYCEDHDFLLRLSQEHKIYHLSETLAIVHRIIGSKGGQSGATALMRAGERRMYQKFSATNRGGWFPFLYLLSKLKEVRKIAIKLYR